MIGFSVFISLIEENDPFRWKGYFLSVVLFWVATVFGVTIHYSVFTRDRCNMRIQSALSAAIYRKVSEAWRQKTKRKASESLD